MVPMLWTAMVKAAVCEQYKGQGRNKNIWLTRQAMNILLNMPSLTQYLTNHAVQAFLGACPAASYARHDITAFFWIEDISH
jgi:hypothetical protein